MAGGDRPGTSGSPRPRLATLGPGYQCLSSLCELFSGVPWHMGRKPLRCSYMWQSEKIIPTTTATSVRSNCISLPWSSSQACGSVSPGVLPSPRWSSIAGCHLQILATGKRRSWHSLEIARSLSFMPHWPELCLKGFQGRLENVAFILGSCTPATNSSTVEGGQCEGTMNGLFHRPVTLLILYSYKVLLY